MDKEGPNKTQKQLLRHLNVIVVIVLAAVYLAAAPESLIRSILGWFFLFLPGYSLARMTIKNWKSNFVAVTASVIVFSLSINPLVGNIIQFVTFLNAHSMLAAILLFSLPIMLASNLKSKSSTTENLKDTERPQTKIGAKAFLFRNAAFFGSLIVALGLYVQASIGAVAPRGMDIYGHMNLVNSMVTSGKGFFRPDLNVLSNFYHYFYAEIVILTGLDVLKAALVAQVVLGGALAITVYYFAEYVTGSSVGSFISSVLFIAGPPLYSDTTRYFYYFHPMYVALAIFPFALVYVHKCLSGREEENSNVASIVILAAFLYHLSVGFILAAILLLDSLLLLKSKWKLLLPRLARIAALTILISAAITIPFILNMSNPFRYVYTTGGLETIRSMMFGLSTYAFSSPLVGWAFFTQNFQEFATRILPLLALGVPALFLSLRKKLTSLPLLLSSMLVGVLGIIQPYFGVAIMPQRFIQPTLIFGATAVGLLISYIPAIPTIRFEKKEQVIKMQLKLSKTLSRSALIGLMLCYVVFTTYLLAYSPAQEAVLDAELYLNSDDLTAIRWIEANVPRNSNILMDQYLQIFFAGVTGRSKSYSITAERPLYRVWDVYPVSVYIGLTDPLKVNVDYLVISPWCYTTWDFVGKTYFDQNSNLTMIFEYKLYAVYALAEG